MVEQEDAVVQETSFTEVSGCMSYAISIIQKELHCFWPGIEANKSVNDMSKVVPESFIQS